MHDLEEKTGDLEYVALVVTVTGDNSVWLLDIKCHYGFFLIAWCHSHERHNGEFLRA